MPLLSHASAKEGYAGIAEKFAELEGYGPTSVRKFVGETAILGERTADQWQRDAFGQVQAWLKALDLNNKKPRKKPAKPPGRIAPKKRPAKKKAPKRAEASRRGKARRDQAH